MKKFFVLSSWSRIAAIGSIFMVAFLAACGDDDSWSPSDADNSRSSSVIQSGDSHDIRDCATCCASGVILCGEGSSDSRSSDSKGSSSSADKEESSSSSVILSSSEGSSPSSGSVVLATPCKTETEDNCEYGELTDVRDGQTYKTVKIGDQWWMAQNLNYETANSYCYKDDAGYCTMFGRLYTWAAAVGKSDDVCGYDTCSLPLDNIQGVCPEGWHLPNEAEFKTLFSAVDGISTAGKMLKSTIHWYNVGDGTDAFGFSGLPAGGRNYNGDYDNVYKYASFWSSTEYDRYQSYHVYLGYTDSGAKLIYCRKYHGLSVRCIKD